MDASLDRESSGAEIPRSPSAVGALVLRTRSFPCLAVVNPAVFVYSCALPLHYCSLVSHCEMHPPLYAVQALLERVSIDTTVYLVKTVFSMTGKNAMPRIDGDMTQ